jgi:predicted nucleic-acid-binding protein
MVSKSVVLELEWVMRGYYAFAQAEVASVVRHLLDQAHIRIEDRDAVDQALSNFEAGIDFTDALHHASYRSCDSVATFDDRKFARRATKLGLAPAVVVVPQPAA